MTFDFLNEMNTSSEVVTGTRGVGESTEPIVKTAPTPGNINITTYGAKYMGITDGSRVVVAEAPSEMVACPITNPTTDESFIMYRGVLSNREAAVNRYEATNPHSFAQDSDEYADYLLEMEAAVTAELKEKGLEDNDHVGSLARKTGNNYQFSSKTPWVLLGGTKNGNVELMLNKCYGVVFPAQSDAILLTDDNKNEDFGNIKGIAVINPANTLRLWGGVATVAEALNGAPFFTMEFIEFSAKTSRTESEKESTPSNVPTELVDSDLIAAASQVDMEEDADLVATADPLEGLL